MRKLPREYLHLRCFRDVAIAVRYHEGRGYRGRVIRQPMTVTRHTGSSARIRIRWMAPSVFRDFCRLLGGGLARVAEELALLRGASVGNCRRACVRHALV